MTKNSQYGAYTLISAIPWHLESWTRPTPLQGIRTVSQRSWSHHLYLTMSSPYKGNVRYGCMRYAWLCRLALVLSTSLSLPTCRQHGSHSHTPPTPSPLHTLVTLHLLAVSVFDGTLDVDHCCRIHNPNITTTRPEVRGPRRI